ncbi:MAG TPA: magnesium/cobalt transporter CorA [Methanotrichaceae archaeon]|nr:magnesium/cobalt transporter CorA [Methanotrichaceae archaeon]
MALQSKGSNLSDLPPSSPPPDADRCNDKPRITVIDYDESHYQEIEVKSVEECFVFKGRTSVTWINIDCLHKVGTLDKLGACYGFHPLVLEDILSDQRPKAEDYDSYIFVVLKMLFYTEDADEPIHIDQVSMILGPNYVISFKEKEADIFNPIRDKLRTAKGKIRRMGADYLAYSMIDTVVDHYFIILEKLGDRFEDLEDAVVSAPDPGVLPVIYNLKRDMLFLRKSVFPLREAISVLQRSDSPLITDNTKIYLRDVYDHTIQIIDNIETFRDMAASLLDTYLSSLSNRLNEVIKVLTVISTIFIPLTFLSGLFGMNVLSMVKWLEHPWAFYLIAGTMMSIVLVMLMYFRRKGWF